VAPRRLWLETWLLGGELDCGSDSVRLATSLSGFELDSSALSVVFRRLT
jgi:hypothetical protein